MKWFKSKAQIMWIRSLLFLICILLIVVTILTTWMINTFTNELSRVNNNLTSLVQKSVDTRLEEIRNISTQIELSATNLSISKMKNTSKLDSASHYSFANQIRNYKLANHYINDIYIYYPAIDYVVGNLGSFQSDHYFILNNNLTKNGVNEWKNGLLTRDNKNYYFSGNKLIFSRQLPYNELAQVDANIIIEINRTEILNLLESTEADNKTTITALITPDNNVYAAVGSNAEEVIAALPSNILSTDQFVEYGKYFIFKRESEISGIKYITIVNQAEMLEKVYYTRNIAYLVILGCFIIGMFMSLYLSKRNSKPLFSLINKLKMTNTTNETEVKSFDEYKLIEHEIDLILNESMKSNFRVETQRVLIESMFLSNILSLELRSNQAIFSLMQRLDLEFPYPQFVVMIIRHHQDKQLHQKLKDRTLTFKCIATEFQDDLVVLIHIENSASGSDLKYWATEVKGLIEENNDVKIMFGGIYDSLSDIVTSYHQARNILDMTENKQDNVYIYDVTVIPEQFDHQFSSMMVDFNHYMDIQRYDEAMLYTEAMINQFVIHEDHTYLARCRKYAILNRIIDELYSINHRDSNFQAENYINQLAMSNSNQELKKIIVQVIKICQEKQQVTSDRQSSSIAQRAREIIELKYSDPMIGLYSISEQLNVTNTYLSKVFKDTFDYGLAQYINLKRIEQAKILILTTSLSVKQISTQVGFSSDVTFIRVFKQFTNTTPGKFKK